MTFYQKLFAPNACGIWKPVLVFDKSALGQSLCYQHISKILDIRMILKSRER